MNIVYNISYDNFLKFLGELNSIFVSYDLEIDEKNNEIVVHIGVDDTADAAVV